MHVVTLIRRIDGSGEPHRDFPGLQVMSYEDDAIEFIEVTVPVLNTWIVAFYASDYLFTDYELVGVEVAEKGNEWKPAGKLSPLSNAPPNPFYIDRPTHPIPWVSLS